MAIILADRVRDTTTSTGSPFTLSGTAPLKYRTFSAVMAVSDTTYAFFRHQTQNQWQVAAVTYSASNQLTLGTVFASSNAGAAVTFTAGTIDVVLDVPAAKRITSDFAAANADVFAGTNTAKFVTPDALAALWEYGSVASASTMSLGDGGYFHVSGTATINDIDFTAASRDGRAAILVFDGAATLVHSATMILPGGVNILAVAGDCCLVVQDAGDNVKVVAYFRGSGALW